MPAWEQVHWSGRPPPEPQRPPRLKPNSFARAVRFSVRNALFVVLAVAFISIIAAAYALFALRFDQPPRAPVALDQHTAAAEAALDRRFPGIDSSFSARVTFDTVTRSRAMAIEISKRLAARQDLFASAEVPGSSEFYQRYGIVYRSSAEIDAIVRRALSLRPLLGAFQASPNIAAVAALAGQIDKAFGQGGSPRGFTPIFDALAASTEAANGGHREPVDWTNIAGLAADDGRSAWYVIAAPVPGREQAAAEYAGLATAERQVTWNFPPGALPLRIDWLRDAVVPLLLAAIIALILLFAGLNKASHVAAVLSSMLASLGLSAGGLAATGAQLTATDWGFAMVVCGSCALSGVAYCAAYQRQRAGGLPQLSAMMLAAQEQTWPLLGLAGLGIACWACWLPRAIAALVPISATAMVASVLALAFTVTLVPSVIALCEGRNGAAQAHWLDTLAEKPLSGHVINALNIAVLLALAAGAFSSVFLAGLRFGDAAGQSALNGGDAGSPGFAIHVMAPAGDPARALAAQLEKLPEAASVLSIETFLPPDADAKLAALRALSGYLPAPQDLDAAAALSPDAALRDDLDLKLAGIIQNPNAEAGLRQAAARLARALALAPAASLADVQSDWFSGLPAVAERAEALARLAPPQISDLDPMLQRRFIAADGTWRIEVLPRPGIGRLTFAASIRRIVPDAAGRPIVALASNEIMHHEAAIATAMALAAAAAVVLLALRNVVDWIVAQAAILLYLCLAAAVMALSRGPVDPSVIAAAVAGMAGCASVTLLRIMGRQDGKADDGAPGMPGSGPRPALFPPLIVAGLSAGLLASGQAAIWRFGMLAMELQLVAAAIAMLVVPRVAAWLHGLKQE